MKSTDPSSPSLPMQPVFRLISDPRFQQERNRAAYVLYLAILVLGSIPGAREQVGHVASGFLLHAVAYGTIAFLLFEPDTARPLRQAWTTLLAVAFMGAADEALQSALPYRTGALADWLVDLNAAGLVLAGCLRWRRRLCSSPPA